MITNLSQQLRQFRNGRKPRSPHQNFRSWIVAYNRRIRILMSSSSLCLLPFFRFAYSSFFTLPTPLSSLFLLLFLQFAWRSFSAAAPTVDACSQQIPFWLDIHSQIQVLNNLLCLISLQLHVCSC